MTTFQLHTRHVDLSTAYRTEIYIYISCICDAKSYIEYNSTNQIIMKEKQL